MNKRIITSLIINLIIFCLMLFSLICSLIGFYFMEGNNALSEPSLMTFKFFTTDSNIVAGITSLVLAVSQILYITRHKKIPEFAYILKLIGTSSVTLTLMVTVFFLAPKSSAPASLFRNSNLFFHLIIPLLCIFSFVFLEKISSITIKQTFFGVLPMILYSIYYVTNIFMHLNNGNIDSAYDWYGFFILGVKSIYIIFPLILAITYFFTWILWLGNKSFLKKDN